MCNRLRTSGQDQIRRARIIVDSINELSRNNLHLIEKYHNRPDVNKNLNHREAVLILDALLLNARQGIVFKFQGHIN